MNFNLEILRTFASVKIQAPEKYEELGETITKLEAASEEWEQKGVDELDATIDQAKEEHREERDHEERPKKKGGRKRVDYNAEDDSAFPSL